MTDILATFKLHTNMVDAIRRGQKTTTRLPMRPQPRIVPFPQTNTQPYQWPFVWTWKSDKMPSRYTWGDNPTCPHGSAIAEHAPLGPPGFRRAIALPDGELTDIVVKITHIGAERLHTMEAQNGHIAEGFLDSHEFIRFWNKLYTTDLSAELYYSANPWVWVYTLQVIQMPVVQSRAKSFATLSQEERRKRMQEASASAVADYKPGEALPEP